MTPPRFGVFLSTRLAGLGGDHDAAEFLQHARLAEACGFASVWVGDSLVARPRLEPLTLLAAVAAQTTRVALGTAVLLPALRHPLTTAHALATIDRIAAGRLIVAVGSGFAYPGTMRELELVGVAMNERVARVVEAVDIWRALWRTHEPVSYPGRFWSFTDVLLAPQPVRLGGPPIWLGGNSRSAIRRAARIADGFFPTSASPETFATAWRQVVAAAEAAARRPGSVTPAVVLTLHVDDDRERAQRELRAYMEAYYGAPLERLREFIGCFAGSPSECRAWLERYVASGARHIVLRFASRDQRTQIERAAAMLGFRAE